MSFFPGFSRSKVAPYTPTDLSQHDPPRSMNSVYPYDTKKDELSKSVSKLTLKKPPSNYNVTYNGPIGDLLHKREREKKVTVMIE